jgi:hypothetical protein
MPSGLGSIFSSMLLTSFATDLLDSRYCTNNTALSYENDPLLTVQLREEENTVAWKGMPGEEGNNYQNYMTYSWQELYIDVFPSFYVDTAQGP